MKNFLEICNKILKFMDLNNKLGIAGGREILHPFNYIESKFYLLFFYAFLLFLQEKS